MRATEPNSADLTDDAFLGGALQILQPKSAYRAGLDAVLLAAAVPVLSGGARPDHDVSILDAGAGVGVVGLAIARRCPAARLTLVEIEPQLVYLARENVRRNGLTDRVVVVEADVGQGGAGLAAAGFAQGQFAHVVANPPYQTDGTGSRSPDPIKAKAHAMAAGSLEAWIRFLAAATRAGGTATIVHRADALPEILATLSPRFGALKVLPVYPWAGEPARRLIVQGIKGSKAPLQLLPGLVLHDDSDDARPHAFRSEIDAILRHGAPLLL